jgi:hypothetical protein
MDYNIKYIKYKNKYLNYKNLKGGSMPKLTESNQQLLDELLKLFKNITNEDKFKNAEDIYTSLFASIIWFHIF